MILSDGTILKYIKEQILKISPFNPKKINASSVNLTLADEFIEYTGRTIRTDKPNLTNRFKADIIFIVPRSDILNYTNGAYNKDILTIKEEYPDKTFKTVLGGVLGTTVEKVEIPNDLASQYQGRSSFGRVFLQSHQTAGWIDAGFEGKITLEITAHDKPIFLFAGDEIGQLIYHKMDRPADKPYNGRYQGQDGVVASKAYLGDLPTTKESPDFSHGECQ